MILPTLLAVSLAAPVPKAKAANYYHPTVEGTTRVMQMNFNGQITEHTQTVTKVVLKDGVYTVTSSSDQLGRTTETTVEVSAKGVFRPAPSGQEKGEPSPLIKLPLREGDTWTVEIQGPGKGTTLKTTCTVGKVEEVTVPAGKFKAVAVAMETDLGGRVTKATSWYAADGVGLVKRVTAGEVERVQELKEFTPGKAK
jgi:hypothetical protein